MLRTDEQCLLICVCTLWLQGDPNSLLVVYSRDHELELTGEELTVRSVRQRRHYELYSVHARACLNCSMQTNHW
jgi:hypothetical protein